MRVVVLGCGRVGGPMAEDLALNGEFDVKVVDRDPAALERLKARCSVKTAQGDLSDPGQVRAHIAEADIVLSAVPGRIGFATLKTIIEAKKPAVDIAFFPEDPLALDPLAKRCGVPAIVDCGVMPGAGSMLAGKEAAELDEVDDVLIMVGGLPIVRSLPFEYKAVFSPADVIEEYVRPARFVENGQIVTRPALSEPEIVEFPGVGSLEAFNTDGLRTMLHTIQARNMKERTLRYPGHIDKMAFMRGLGLFDTAPIAVGSMKVSPLEFTSALLFPHWNLKEGEGDITVMRIEVSGTKNGKVSGARYDLFDRYDPKSDVISMARTTGYTATAAVRMIAQGLFREPGITPPERLGPRAECVNFIMSCLEERSVRFHRSELP